MSSPLWRIESVFDGLGGDPPRLRRGARPSLAERTRVLLVFDAAGGVLVPDLPLQIWQERQWSLEPSAELTFRERKADGSYDRLDGSGLKRSGIEGGWVSSAVGYACFGDSNAARKPPRAPPTAGLFSISLAGGIEVRGAPGLLEVACTSAEGRELKLRRTDFDADRGVCLAERVK